MANTKLKCTFCGNEQEGELSIKETVCSSCKKPFITERGAKYYNSMVKLAVTEKKVAYGEMFKKVDTLVSEGEFYLANEDFENAKQKFLSALEITTVDVRVYLGLVKSHTKNFTDYNDKTHFEYLNKAISFATKHQKEEIRTMYKAYYEVSNYTPEELSKYSEEELNQRKAQTEQVLKDGIPRHYKSAENVKTYKVLLPIFFALSLVVFAVSLFIKNETATLILDAISISFMLVALALIIALSGLASKASIFDFALDFYDAFDDINLTVKEGVNAFTALETLAVDYLNGATPTTLENSLSEIILILVNSDDEKANNFVLKYKIANKIIKNFEEN